MKRKTKGINAEAGPGREASIETTREVRKF
jgi:hypothetical protein